MTRWSPRGELKPDPAQARAVAALDRLAAQLDEHGGFLPRLFGKRQRRSAASICGAGSGAASRC